METLNRAFSLCHHLLSIKILLQGLLIPISAWYISVQILAVSSLSYSSQFKGHFLGEDSPDHLIRHKPPPCHYIYYYLKLFCIVIWVLFCLHQRTYSNISSVRSLSTFIIIVAMAFPTYVHLWHIPLELYSTEALNSFWESVSSSGKWIWIISYKIGQSQNGNQRCESILYTEKSLICKQKL